MKSLLGILISLLIVNPCFAQIIKTDTFYIFTILHNSGNGASDFDGHYFIQWGDTATDATNYFVLKDIPCGIEDSSGKISANKFLKSKFIRHYMHDTNVYLDSSENHERYYWKCWKCYGSFFILRCFLGSLRVPFLFPIEENAQIILTDVHYFGKVKDQLPKQVQRKLHARK